MALLALASAPRPGDGGLSVPMDKGVGLAAGAAGGYWLGGVVRDSTVVRVVTNGISARTMGAAVGLGTAKMPGVFLDTISAGMGVEAAAHFVDAENGMMRLVADGVGAKVGQAAPHVPEYIAKSLDVLAKEHPNFHIPAKVAAGVAENAPRALGTVAGSAWGVAMNRAVLQKMPTVLAVGGALAGMSYLASKWDTSDHLRIGG